VHVAQALVWAGQRHWSDITHKSLDCREVACAAGPHYGQKSAGEAFVVKRRRHFW